MISDRAAKAYEQLREAAVDNGVFDAKTTTLIKLAAAMALGCAA